MDEAASPGVRRLAIFDLDGTLTRADTFGPFVLGLLRRHPARALRLPLLLFPAAGYLLRITDRGGLKSAVLRLVFGNLPRAAVEGFAAGYARHVVEGRTFPAALAALRSHVAAGDFVVLLSASPDLYVPRIGSLLGVAETHCTRIRWNGDRLDGHLEGRNRRDEEKLRVLEHLRATHPGLPFIAYGNSAPDLIHMAACEQAVYVNANRGLAQRLTARGIRCVRWR
ncbi:MAG TPA: HAD-IB family phosphatase [Steroidobacteraceae bacterium]|nr:HAD-IB family phosphatase [Steroidobacteraceae bacterium]